METSGTNEKSNQYQWNFIPNYKNYDESKTKESQYSPISSGPSNFSIYNTLSENSSIIDSEKANYSPSLPAYAPTTPPEYKKNKESHESFTQEERKETKNYPIKKKVITYKLSDTIDFNACNVHYMIQEHHFLTEERVNN